MTKETIDIRMLDALDVDGVVGYVVYDGADLILRTPKNPNNVLRPKAGACGAMVAGEWTYEFFVFMFNANPDDIARTYYEQMLNDGKTTYQVVKQMMSLASYKDYRFCNGMKNADWVNRMFCLFYGLDYNVASANKALWYSYIINRSRDCTFIELLKSVAGRAVLDLGNDDTKINALWTDNAMSLPGCTCDSINIPDTTVNLNPTNYTTPGTYSYTVEKGVTSLTFVIVGGGGTGADSASTLSTFKRQGGGGGQAGDVLVAKSVPVSEGDVVQIAVGAGGKTGQIAYQSIGSVKSGDNSSVVINGQTLIAQGGKPGIDYVAGGNTPTGGANSSQGVGGLGGVNSLAQNAALGGAVGFPGNDWTLSKGADGSFPGGGGGGAGADDKLGAFPGGDGADGAVYMYKNGYRYQYVEQTLSPLTAGQNAKRYIG